MYEVKYISDVHHSTICKSLERTYVFVYSEVAKQTGTVYPQHKTLCHSSKLESSQRYIVFLKCFKSKVQTVYNMLTLYKKNEKISTLPFGGHQEILEGYKKMNKSELAGEQRVKGIFSH